MERINLALRKLRMKNFKCYDDYVIDFHPEDCDGAFMLFGLFGKNGCGKTTVLDAINLVFTSFGFYDTDRLSHALKKYIRNFKNLPPEEQLKANFLIEAEIVSDVGEYKVMIDKNGFIDGFTHPQEIFGDIVNTCFRTRYDEELNNFQLRKDKWPIFKELFESVTGYVIEQEETSFFAKETFENGEEGHQDNIMSQYVLGVKIQKPNETITDRECSKGEKKILKNFTTLLNKPIIPQIIVIDDIEMHVELSRHMNLLLCVEKCFPDSQVIFTSHSPKIIYNFDIDRLHDLTSKSGLANVLWRKKLIRVLEKSTFFDEEILKKESVKNILTELRETESLELSWAKSAVVENIFECQNNQIKFAESVNE